MSSQATRGALVACLIAAAVVGFAGGAMMGSRDGDAAPSGATTEAPDDAAREEPADPGLTLAADPTTVPSGGLVAISGSVAPEDAGVEVKVQHRIGDGAWTDFPNPQSVISPVTRADGTFSGSVAPRQQGTNFYRVVQLDDESRVSNTVEITVQN